MYSFQCDCSKGMNKSEFFFHYVHHKDVTIGLGDNKELKEKVIWWIQHATDQERSSFSEVMLCKQMMLDEWLDKFGATDEEVDELVIYMVSRLLQEPIAMITKTCFWSSVEGGSNYISGTNIVFAFGGEGHFIPLERAELQDPGMNCCTNCTVICITICILHFRCTRSI